MIKKKKNGILEDQEERTKQNDIKIEFLFFESFKCSPPFSCHTIRKMKLGHTDGRGQGPLGAWRTCRWQKLPSTWRLEKARPPRRAGTG